MDRIRRQRCLAAAQQSVRGHLESVSVPAGQEVLLTRRSTHVHVAHVVVVVDDILPSAATASQAVADLDPGGSVETILEIVSDHPEVGQTHPAGLDGARSGHSVALAFLAHLRLDVLLRRKKEGKWWLD